MSRKPRSTIAGFDFATQGTLLTRVISEDAAGFCHERSVSYRKTWHRHDRLNLAFPRGGSIIRYKTRSHLELRTEPHQFMVLQADVEHMHWAETTVWNNFALFPSREIVAELGGAKVLRSLPELAAFDRSSLLNDALEKLLHDAIFRKVDEAELRPTYLFVLQLAFDEIRGRVASPPKKAGKDDSGGASRVLIYVENKLFEDLDPNDIAAKMGVSRASLYRNFKNATGRSIMGYVRHRRMEEARQLMKAGSLNLGDIAQLVGYEDLYTFSAAYKNIFGVAPSKDPAVPRAAKSSRA
jgi:AraC-like DNA-binding protein